jgi:hypothetical protein
MKRMPGAQRRRRPRARTRRRRDTDRTARRRRVRAVVVAALRRRNARDDRLEDFLDADAFLGAGEIASLPSIISNSSISCFTRSGSAAGKIDLVDHRDDREVLLEREMVVRQRLRFDALGGVDHEQRALRRPRASA